MKTILLLLLLVAPILSFSQDFGKNKEKAYFAVNHQGNSAFSTIVKFKDGNLTKVNFSDLARIMSEKEGIFELTRIDDACISISHLSEIDVDTLKDFLLMVKSDPEIAEPEEYTFN
jgi:hypothetical protein